MNGITEPLPGLLDDPQLQITDLPAWSNVQIAPLRNPAPSRHANVPSPLEPVAGNILSTSRATKSGTSHEPSGEKRRNSRITPGDVLLAREAKKPHLAISELLEAEDGPELLPTQLPSFVSLAVVEKSPIQMPMLLEHRHMDKRLRLDMEGNSVALDMIRHLPPPAQKDDRQKRPAPLLPAMVTGLHEPPPSAALLPSIDVQARPVLARANTSSKIHVKDMLTEDRQDAPPRMVICPSTSLPDNQGTPSKDPVAYPLVSTPKVSVLQDNHLQPELPSKDNKTRRTRRKWTESETNDLIAGVKRYGIGKWKQILEDPDFNFCERSSVDLKDRYRVCANNDHMPKWESHSSTSTPAVDHASPVVGADAATDASSPPKHSSAADSPSEQNNAPRQRRKRRAWTTTEDDNLLKGVNRHGFQWTAIHGDPELQLSHRRATDLRDRIRNKFPDGYRHAGSAPLRSELKKAEKLAVAASGTPEAAASKDLVTTSAPAFCPVGNALTKPQARSNTSTPTPTPSSARISTVTTTTTTITTTITSKVKSSTSASSLTMLLHSEDKEHDYGRKDKDKDEREKDKEHYQAGVTLPSFTLGEDVDMNWEDNRLPPLHEWEEIGI